MNTRPTGLIQNMIGCTVREGIRPSTQGFQYFRCVLQLKAPRIRPNTKKHKNHCNLLNNNADLLLLASNRGINMNEGRGEMQVVHLIFPLSLWRDCTVVELYCSMYSTSSNRELCCSVSGIKRASYGRLHTGSRASAAVNVFVLVQGPFCFVLVLFVTVIGATDQSTAAHGWPP